MRSRNEKLATTGGAVQSVETTGVIGSATRVADKGTGTVSSAVRDTGAVGAGIGASSFRSIARGTITGFGAFGSSSFDLGAATALGTGTLDVSP